MSNYENEDIPPVKLEELNSYSRKVYTTAKVISKTDPREVTSRRDDSTHRVSEALIADDSGSIYLTLWDEAIDDIGEDMILEIKNAYVNVFRGSMRLNIGRYGSYEIIEDSPFEEVNLENNLSSRQVEFSGRGRRGGRRDDRGGNRHRRW
jgi:replication factor A1